MLPTRMLGMMPTRAFLSAAPKQGHSAHTISQRLRQLKQIPPELLPLGAVIVVALTFGSISITRKLMTDKTLRLSRNSVESREH